MATATITLSDDGDGGVNLSCEFDPVLNKDAGLTEAQAFALGMIESAASPEELQAARFSR